MKPSQFILTLLLSGILLTTACAAQPTPADPAPEAQPEILNSEAESPDQEPGASPFEVIDALGRKVTFEEPPTRILLTGKALFMIADTLYTFPEAGQRIAASGDASQAGKDFISIIDPSFPDKVILARDAGPEQIAAANPDVVILKSYLEGQMGQPLEALNIPVIYIDFETPEQYQRDLLILGGLFHNEERAVEVASFFDQRANQIESLISSVEEEQKPRVLLLYFSDKDGAVAFNVPPENWMQTTMVKSAGGIPVWANAQLNQGWTKVTLEQIAAWDPDKIFIAAYFNPVDEVVENLKDDPQWQALRAVQDGQLLGFAADLYSWDQPDTRWILGLTWLAGKLHPDLFPDLDITSETQIFYEQLYGISKSDFDAKILPEFSGDLP
jgi:iron complex transport system substrate-binding protein